MFNPRAEMNEYREKQERFLSRATPEKVVLQDRPSGMIIDTKLSVDKVTVVENTVTVWAKPQHPLHPGVLRRVFRRAQWNNHPSWMLGNLLLFTLSGIAVIALANGSWPAASFIGDGFRSLTDVFRSIFFSLSALAAPLFFISLLVEPPLTSREWAAETKRKIAEFQFRYRTSAGIAAEALRHDPKTSLRALRVLSEPEGTDIARKTAANIVGRLVEAQRYEEELERAAESAEEEALARFESTAGTPVKQLADEEEMRQLDYELRASGK